MANSYATVPAIIPGNLTVNGKLTVSGGQIALGKFQRQYRIQEIANGQFVETVNVDRIAGAQDDATVASLMRVIYATGIPFAVATEPAGSPMTDTYLLNQQQTALQVLTPELRVGAVKPYTRVISNPPNAGEWTVNLQQDGTTRDDATKPGFRQLFDVSGSNLSSDVMNSAGNLFPGDLRRMFWYDHQQHTNAGSTAPMTIASKVVRANTLGPHGGVCIRFRGTFTTVAGGGLSFYIGWGGANRFINNVAASLNQGFACECFLSNSGTTGNQIFLPTGIFGSGSIAQAAIGLSVDTTVDQTVSIVTQAVNTGDNVSVQVIEVEYVSRAFPI